MRPVSLLIALALALAAAAPASAQDGVFVDPDSPSGKEYRLPVDSVRRGTSPKKTAPSRNASGEEVQPAAPLFGEGVEKDSADGSGGGSGSGSGGKPGAGENGDGQTPAQPPASEPTAAPREEIPAASLKTPVPAGGSSGLLYGSIALVLCAAGAATGWWLRRRRPA